MAVTFSTWKVFSLGLGIRLVGAGLIVLGDGHPSLFRKGLVTLGVILTVGGIGVLKYLLYGGLRRRTKGVEPVNDLA